MKAAVTGAYSYSGKYIASRLLARGVEVVTLTGHPDRSDPFEGQVPAFALDFSRPRELQNALAGCDVLVNTYWIRFDRGANTQARAVENTASLFAAATAAGVSRVVHISITNPSPDSPLSYFRGKAQNEQIVMGSSMGYAILRPTVLFGREDILINNIAFLLRKFPVFLIAGDGKYAIQPTYVDDLASLVEQAVFKKESYVVDAVGPEVYSFRSLVGLIGATIGTKRPVVPVVPAILKLSARVLGAFLGDTLLTAQELDGLMANLLISSEPARCPTSLSQWLAQHADRLGRTYASELKRHYA
jgi:uncharacterized protein YbjT (DUF2867 family)